MSDNELRKQHLALLVDIQLAKVEEFARGRDDSLKTKDQKQNRRKCSQCGKSYLGQKNSDTCGGACRTAKSRG